MMMKTGIRKPTDVDKYVGRRLRRQLLGISQEKLANKMELSFQQVQKYEQGATRITAGRLFLLSNVLEVPISYFYEDFSQELVNDDREDDIEALLTNKDVIKLLRKYVTLTNKNPDYINTIHSIFDSFIKVEKTK